MSWCIRRARGTGTCGRSNGSDHLCYLRVRFDGTEAAHATGPMSPMQWPLTVHSSNERAGINGTLASRIAAMHSKSQK